ncbi:MAG: hypothetical protein A2W19_00305 [Spirochaetes bacterium RBG_16_49_21]|nr:MAG: hypothetical protein A2W19_00305 [Spirochaetes bacterium RBG_16_49_21]
MTRAPAYRHPASDRIRNILLLLVRDLWSGGIFTNTRAALPSGQDIRLAGLSTIHGWPAGIIEKTVNPAEAGNGQIDQRLDLRLSHDVCFLIHDICAQPFGELRPFLLRSACNNDFGAFGGEDLGGFFILTKDANCI